MVRCLVRFGRDAAGSTAIEYGLIAALLAMAIIGALITIGGDLSVLFGDVSAGFQPATP